VIGLILFIRGDAIITAEEGTLRLASVYGSPNNLALLLSRVIPFAICFVLASRDRIRLFWLVALVVLLLTMALTQSSGGLFVALPIMLATLIILRWKRRSILPLFALALIFIFFLSVAAQLSPRVERLVSLNSTTAFMRIRVWESSLDMIADHPLTGLGLDQFLYEFRSHYIRPDAIADPDLSHPHNIILDFWIRLGLFGVVWLIVTVSGTLLTAARSLRSQLFNPVMAGSFVSFITLIGYGLIDNSIFLPDLIIIFVILLYVPFSTTAESIT
jgi:O-antigen ligase